MDGLWDYCRKILYEKELEEFGESLTECYGELGHMARNLKEEP